MRTPLALAALALVVCPAMAAETHTVLVDGMKFQPEVLTVKRGETVVWRNQDIVPHTATAAGRFDSGLLAPGKSWSWKAEQAGRFAYVCSYHPGMKAAVVVQ